MIKVLPNHSKDDKYKAKQKHITTVVNRLLKQHLLLTSCCYVDTKFGTASQDSEAIIQSANTLLPIAYIDL
jgi:hypothetical protein